MTVRHLGVPAPAATVAPQAVRFDAVGDKYSRSATGLGTGSTDWTMTAWVKLAVDRNAYSTFFGCDNASSVNVMSTFSDGTTSRRVCTSNESAGSAMTIGTWYFIGMTWFNAASDFMYKATAGDAATVETATSTGGGAVADSWTFYIGNNGFNSFLNGSIAAMKVWTRGLTKAQIDAEMPSLAVVGTSNLWGYYPFNAGPDTADYSGNSRTLTAGGTLTADTSGPPIT